MPFSSERLIYRSPIESDEDDYLKMWNDPDYQHAVSFDYPRPQGKKWMKESLQTMTKDALFHGIITLKDTGEFLGEITVMEVAKKNRDGFLGIGLVEKHRGKGYGTEAMKYALELMFTSFGLHRVSLAVFEDNVGAIALYKKLGFVEEGRKRKENWARGKWNDVLGMSILEDEWAALRTRV